MLQDLSYDKLTKDMILEKINIDYESYQKEINNNLTISKQEDICYVDKYLCNIDTCKKKFKTKKRFDKHVKSHFYHNVYKCEYENCPKVYRSKENLTLHIKNIHLNIKPYRCTFCKLEFSHRNGRIYHERRSHGDRMDYSCRSIML
jgi:hypothetical protein